MSVLFFENHLSTGTEGEFIGRESNCKRIISSLNEIVYQHIKDLCDTTNALTECLEIFLEKRVRFYAERFRLYLFFQV
jgi:flagellar biosynthesis chaperone FliJ